MSKIDKIIKEQNCSLMCDTVRQIANERNRFEACVKELEEKLNAQFAEMEEKLTAEEMKNFKLKEKLKIAEEALNNIHHFDCDTCKKLKFKCNGSCDSKVDKIIEQALQKIKEVDNE